MQTLTLIGIGTGNPDHLTLQAIRAMNAADLILIPRKGESKSDLADLRRAICNEVLSNPTTRIAEFDLPTRDPAIADYVQRVEEWHDAIAVVWSETIAAIESAKDNVALLVWGDASLYDSTLRIAARLRPTPEITVIPGITSLQALTAAHAIPLNALAEPVTITTGRNLRDLGWPPETNRIAVMLDGECSFHRLDPNGVTIWWGCNIGLPSQEIISGSLAQVGTQIIAKRKDVRAKQGWVMDIYLLERKLPTPQ